MGPIPIVVTNGYLCRHFPPEMPDTMAVQEICWPIVLVRGLEQDTRGDHLDVEFVDLPGVRGSRLSRGGWGCQERDFWS